MKSVSYTYQTDYETRSTRLSQGAADLVLPDSGAIDAQGAVLKSPLSRYELHNLRSDLVYKTVELLQHLNEHIEYYHRMIWWFMDRDRLFMMLDGFYVPDLNPEMSIANIVERDPITVAGNSLVFRVSAGCFLGTGTMKTPEELDAWYDGNGPVI